MPKTRPPYAPKFRRQMIELVRAGRDPTDLAREFEPSAQAIRNWVAEADRQGGRRNEKPLAADPGLAAAEREELARLRGVRTNSCAWSATSSLEPRPSSRARPPRSRPGLRIHERANQASFPVALMTRVLDASKAGYYAWLRRPPLDRAMADAALLKRITTVHASSRET